MGWRASALTRPCSKGLAGSPASNSPMVSAALMSGSLLEASRRGTASASPATTPAGIADTSNPRQAFDRFGFLALLIYSAISVLVFARSLLTDFAGSYIGQGSDPAEFMWFLAWWPYAIAHRVNPFVTHAIYAPGGKNLAWSTTIPLASLVMAPITATVGAVVAYNLL